MLVERGKGRGVYAQADPPLRQEGGGGREATAGTEQREKAAQDGGAGARAERQRSESAGACPRRAQSPIAPQAPRKQARSKETRELAGSEHRWGR